MKVQTININRCRHQCCHPYLRSRLQQLSFGFLKRLSKVCQIMGYLHRGHLMHAVDLLSSYRVLQRAKLHTLASTVRKKTQKTYKNWEEVRMAPWLSKFKTLFCKHSLHHRRSSGLGAVPPRQARSRICRIRTRPGTWRAKRFVCRITMN